MSTVATSTERVQEEIRRKIVEYYIAIDQTGKFLHPPGTDEELFEFIELAYGVQFPRKTMTEGHATPFAFVSDLFFERVEIAIGFANRNGGKTFAVALLNHLDMLFKSNCEIASAGAVRDQADKCYRYFTGFMNLWWFKRLNENWRSATGKPLLDTTIQSETRFNNGSILQILTGTDKGLRGPHPNKFRFDEIDEVAWETMQTGLSMSQSSNGNIGQDVFTSTRQYEHGTMQRLLDESAANGITVYMWNVWEIVEKCERRCFDDPEHGNCPVYTFCEGKAHSCEGFYQIGDFIKKVRVIDRDKFATEWLNDKPAKEKLVYHRFDTQRHIMTPAMLMKMSGHAYPLYEWKMISAIDFGSSPGHPFVYVKLCRIPYRNCWLVFHEYVAEQKLIRDHAKNIKSAPYYLPHEDLFADHDAQDRIELASNGVYTRPAIKGNDSVAVGIDLISGLLQGFPPEEKPLLYVWYQCIATIREFGLYSWPVRSDGKPDRTGRPKQEDDHVMDAIRYALYSYHRKGQNTYRTRSITGL